MATVTSLTAERMLAIERASVVSARRENGELILTTRGGTDINVGDVTGAQGPAGPDGSSRYTWLKYATSPTTGMSNDPDGKNYIGLAYNKPTAIESNDYGDYRWTLIRGPEGQQGVPGPTGADGESTYVWIRYATDVFGANISNSPTGKDYIGFAYNKPTATESSNPGDYTWSLIKGPKGDKGNSGADGIPGPAVTDGLPNFTWLKYATTPTTGMSDDPTDKDYIGLAYNKGTSVESTTYSDYTWSLIHGPQGIQGVQGPLDSNGQPTYVWIKYGISIVGDGLSDDPTGMDYIGVAYNKTTAVESNNPLDYQWSLYKGPPSGADGRGITSTEIGYQASWSGVLVPDGTWLANPPALSAGQYLWTRTKTNYNASPFEVLSYSVGQMGQTGASGTSITSAVVRYQLHDNGSTPPIGTWLENPPSGSPGQWFWTRTVTTYSSGTDTVAYSVSLLGATGPTGSTGSPGRGITSSEITYQAGADGTVIPNQTWFTDVPTVSAGQFLWTRTKTNYSDATYVYSYSVGKIGQTGSQGIQGPAGTSYYTWIRYADSPTTGMSDLPTGKTYIGIAHNKDVITESNLYSDYAWSLIKGEQGIQGPSGYTWIKYGTSDQGAGISDDPAGKNYIGIAYNQITIVESNNPLDYAWSLIQGAAGTPGESVTGQTVQYQLSSSGIIIPTGGTWLNDPPSGSPGQYMWTRITFSYSTLSDSYAYSVAMLGNTGPAGTPAAVINLVATSQVLRSPAAGGVTTPTTVTVTGTATNTTITVWQYSINGGTFSASVPAGVSRSGNVVTITGETMTATTIAVRMADANGIAQSVTVAKIYDGAIGPAGNTGRGISSTEITYQAGTSGTIVPPNVNGWVADPIPSVSPGQYLWTRTIFTYTSGSPTTTTHYSVGGMGSKIDTVTTAYQLSDDGTSTPTGSWVEDPLEQTDLKPFLWTRTITTYLGGPSDNVAYSVSRRGIGVANVEMIYKEISPFFRESFEAFSNVPVEVYRNLTMNPEGVGNGGLLEAGIRNSWIRIGCTDDGPESYISTYISQVVNSGTVGADCGFDWYGDLDTNSYNILGPQVVAGTSYLIRFNIRVSKATTNKIMYRIHNGASWLSNAITINLSSLSANLWATQYAIFTPTQSGYVVVSNRIDATGWSGADHVDQTGLLLCASTRLISWFSGTFSTDTDLEPAWIGSKNNSQSIVTGTPVYPLYSQQNTIGISSMKWAKLDNKSYRLIPNNASNNYSYVYRTLADYNLEVGKTYTVAITLKLYTPQSGTLNSLARRLCLDQASIESNQAPNTIGEHALNVKFTVDGTTITLGAKLMLYDGGSFGKSETFWDDLIIINGEIESDIDTWVGNMPTYDSKMVLYRSEKVTFTDGSISYSPPKIESLWGALELANQARKNIDDAFTILEDHHLVLYGPEDQKTGLYYRLEDLENDTSGNPKTNLGAKIQSISETANGKNKTIRSKDPKVNSLNDKAGDQWYQYDDYNRIINFWIHNGTEWVETRLNNEIFGEIDASKITSGFIDASAVEIRSLTPEQIEGLQDALIELQSTDGAGEIAQAVKNLMSSISIGNGVITISTPDATMSQMKLGSDRLGFWQNGVETAYISESKLVIDNAEIATKTDQYNTLRYGAHEVYRGHADGTPTDSVLYNRVTIFRSI